jgi:TetR/AcrR family transcriptional regulator
MAERQAVSRKQQILEQLASELENNPGSRITTAALAKSVGISEAALYRHFASKAKMFEGLIDFAEDSVFGLVNRILAEEVEMPVRCERILQLLLGFAERNPGITRILIGDALLGENQRLHARVGQFFDRLETQLKQIVREGEAGSGAPKQTAISTANLLLTLAVGKMTQFVRSGFKSKPTAHWGEQWAVLHRGLFET